MAQRQCGDLFHLVGKEPVALDDERSDMPREPLTGGWHEHAAAEIPSFGDIGGSGRTILMLVIILNSSAHTWGGAPLLADAKLILLRLAFAGSLRRANSGFVGMSARDRRNAHGARSNPIGCGGSILID
jgi:hypothetical protein